MSTLMSTLKKWRGKRKSPKLEHPCSVLEMMSEISQVREGGECALLGGRVCICWGGCSRGGCFRDRRREKGGVEGVGELYLHTHIHTLQIHTYTHAHTDTDTDTHTHTHTHTTNTHTHTHTLSLSHTYTHIHTHTHHTHTHTHVHACTRCVCCVCVHMCVFDTHTRL